MVRDACEYCVAQRETISKVTYPHPIWTLCTETEALQTETNASLASTGLIGLLVAFLKN